MAENKGKSMPQGETADDPDVEGHSMMIDPTLAGDMARVRSKDLDRAVRDRNRAKEAKR